MKRPVKYFLYIGIPVILAIAIFIYYKNFNKVEMNDNPTSGVKVQTEQKGATRKALPIEVYIADYDVAEEGHLCVGSLLPRESVDVTSELSGKVVSIEFKEGETVKAGKVLMRLDDRDLQAQLERAEFQLELLDSRLERQKILLEKEAVSQEAYDQVMTEFNVLKQDIEQIKIKIDKSQIKAPFDGIVGFRYISLGAYLQPNSKIASIVDIANLILEFSVSEKYVTMISNGMSAEFTVEGISKRFPSKVFAIDPSLDIKTRSMMIRALFKNSDLQLRPGMSAKVYINTKQMERSIFIPNEAVVLGAKGRSVWVKRDGKAQSVKIEIGTRTEDRIEVQSGLNQGDTVITTGLMQLRQNMPVIVEKVNNPIVL